MTNWPSLDDKLLADAAATFNFRLGIPTPLAVTADGAVLFRRTAARAFASDLYEQSPDGTVKKLASVDELIGQVDEKLSDAEKARRERTRTATRGVVDIDVSEDGRLVMVPLGGVFHLIDRTSGKRVVVDPKGAAYDPHLAPDGNTIAFVRDGDLWTVTPGGEPKQLTKHPADIEYAVAEFAAQEELGRRRGYWWSPDSKSIAFQRTDARGVDTIYVSDPRHPDRPPVPFKYPRAGRPNAVVDLAVIDAKGGQPKWLTWDLAKHPYLAAVTWTKNAPLCALVLDRDQTEVAYISFDGGQAKQLVFERDEAWINVDNTGAPRWLEDGSGFLWMTEAKGDWVLQLRSPDGTLVRELNTPDFGLRSVGGVVGKTAIVSAHTDPKRQDVFRISLDGGQPQRISDGSGFANGFAKKDVVVLDTFHEAGGRSIAIVRGDKSSELPSVAERPSLVPTTVFETVEIGGRTHHAAITRPRKFDRSRKYPVLMKVYAGPHHVDVLAMRDAYVMDQWYADAGFIVVRSDNRGTPHRGRTWERAFLRDLITVAIEDQVGAIKALGARYNEIDLDRIGVTGWSFGGYFSTMAVLLRPDVFKAGVAGAPVTDWELYDTAYTERYMKTPQANPEGYKHTSALTHAHKLSRPLLVIHGITDDNVHFAHTLALVESLYVAGKRAEVITLSATHMVPDPKLNLAREKVQVDFFRDHLGPP